MNFNYSQLFAKHFELFYSEDDMLKNFQYLNSLPGQKVECCIKIKDDLILAGLPFFFESFNYLMNGNFDYSEFLELEGQKFKKTDDAEIRFELPFNIVLSGERIALNLLQRSSSIATYTAQYVSRAKQIKILDTRKTTPGLRFIEKYAVKAGGGYNHRFGQMDAWMVKDNHKSIFGGVVEAYNFFKNQNSFYQPIIVEIHDLNELEKASSAGARHFLLDNFTPSEIVEATKIKKDGMTYEVSGGISLENIDGYLVDGVDAISSGSITYNAPHVDLSLKFQGE
jgi:nicotinate-nucleotide pyrophosphorylase (carboxylating)